MTKEEFIENNIKINKRDNGDFYISSICCDVFGDVFGYVEGDVEVDVADKKEQG